MAAPQQIVVSVSNQTALCGHAEAKASVKQERPPGTAAKTRLGARMPGEKPQPMKRDSVG
jgi:hypothetical protein